MEIWFLLPILVTGVGGTVDVHFENRDGGFFVKHNQRQHYSVVADLAGASGAQADGSSVLSVDRFTVFQTSQPLSVRATYGPFSTKQSVPARFIVPDPIPFNASSSLQELEISAGHHLDMSAHIVRPDIPRDSPVLRVVFHTGADPISRQLHARQRVCVILHVSLGENIPLTAACSPDSDEGFCLAQVTIPASWWPPLTPPDSEGKPTKSPHKSVQVSYSVLEPRGSDSENCIPRVQIQPVTPLASVPLVQARSAYRELRSDDLLSILVPHAPIYPLSRIHIPIYLQLKHGSTVTGFILRARVKSGMRILSGESSSPNQWTVSVELSPKNTLATLTALRRDIDSIQDEASSSLEEVATCLVEVAQEDTSVWEEGKIVWSIRYIHAESSGNRNSSEEYKRKISSRFEIQKDDIQSVLPISKNWDLVNTAVLTGRQVSQAIKVFIVSHAGRVADVTLQSSCHSDDESVLKVSSSCSSVYVDGSEVRGSSNATVVVKYDTYSGLAKFVVWMPEFPLDLNVADFKLSQIKGWKVPSDLEKSIKVKRGADEINHKSKKHSSWTNVASIGGLNVNAIVTEDIGNSIDTDKSSNSCRLRFQQSPVEVYARFLATDHDSGRVSYFVSRRTWLTVTDLIIPSLRVADPRIATLHGKIVQGRSIGRTEVQVMSPITGRVLGAKEIRVTNDKVSVTRMRVHVVSGLQLAISPDTSIDNGFIAQTSVSRKLTAQYQEGLLDIDMDFSDGSRTPLQDIALSDFSLQVESLRPEVVAFAPLVTSSHPRVIAVGPGSGQLLKTVLLPPEVCQFQQASPLLTATAQVQVDFIPNDRPEFVQNDGGSSSSIKERKLIKEVTDLQDILIGLPLKDENNHEPTVQARQHHNSFVNSRRHGNVHLSPLEIGMYVLLAAFCFAIVVFVVSCVVYASKFKPQISEMSEQLPETIPVLGGDHSSCNGIINMKREAEEPTTNVHDWVWLGRATLERASGLLIPASSNRLKPNINKQIRITSNPTYTAEPNPDVDLQLETCFENPNHIELPSQNSVFSPQIDSKTYCKKYKKHQNSAKILPPLPPLPPHNGSVDSEYRPPVPPHRNVGAAAHTSKHFNINGESENEKPHKSHHHHHHHRHRVNINEPCHNHHLELPAKNGSKQEVHQRLSPKKVDGDPIAPVAPVAKFVEYSSPPSEVKRATIVGNPMFSLSNDSSTEKSKDDLLGLDGLNLGMDYQQIMEYFDNLKESNA